MMDALYRALTGQTLTTLELRIAAALIIVWFAMDVIQFVAWLAGAA